ncbi:MAG: GGDEF domain-containing protein [Eubacteriales bacterium]|nr:GGDEF domain-containing protein [Eubacteriales bacterium]
MIRWFLYVQVNLIGLIILGLIYFSQGRRIGRDLDQRYFNRLLLANALILIFDAVTWAVDGQTAFRSNFVNHISNFMYYWTMPLIAYYWLCYCDCRIYGNEDMLHKRQRFYRIPLYINLAMIIINVWTGWVYYIDDARVYHRSVCFLLYCILVFPNMFIAFFLPLYKAVRAKGARRREYYILAMVVLFPLLCGILQFLFYGIGFTWTSIALAQLMIYINVQNRQISTDELTGVNNRRRFNRYLDTLFDGKQPDAPFVMILMDIDDFKLINDTYGHQTGDQALLRTANVLKRCCIDNRFFLARTGGDEFVMTIRACDASTLKTTIETITQRMQKENNFAKCPYRLSVSIGFATLGENGASNQDELFSLADKRMYEVKMKAKAVRPPNWHI